jgi:AAA family ATP:ADP antiporter
MSHAPDAVHSLHKSWLDRALSFFTDVRPGEGMTAVLMLVNIFLLLVCYAVIKTVREPLILLGGGAEVRSYAAAGQALLLMGFVPLYSWFASRVNRARLLVGVTVFFIVCVELFASAVVARVPYVGVAFFIWVGIFNVSLVAQFWSFANDIYDKEAGDRLFPVVVMGMTAGAPLGSFVAARLFRMGLAPEMILQVSALLLCVSVLLYLRINNRQTGPAAAKSATLSAEGGFRLVLSSRYLRLIALLVVLLNVVNTTGEYLVARLLTLHVTELASANPAFDRQAYIGAFSGEYQFWVNVTALMLQAFVASRLIKRGGLTAALLALPLIALGGYSIIAAGVGFSVVRWIKTAENATDYSIMNTARQLLWLPTTREEKYKAKQAIDTFFVRGGDVLSAAVVYLGTRVLHLTVDQFAVGNIALTLVWLGVALMILKPSGVVSRIPFPAVAGRAAAAALVLLTFAAPGMAQETRGEFLAAQRTAKAKTLHPYEPTPLERRLETVDKALSSQRPVYLFMGNVFDGGGFSFGPGYRARYGDSGAFNAHAAWSIRNFKEADAVLKLPTFGNGRVNVAVRGNWLDAPSVPFFGVGNSSSRDDRTSFLYRSTTVGASAEFKVSRHVGIGTSFDAIRMETSGVASAATPAAALTPSYRRTTAFAAFDSRTSPLYTRRGGLYKVEWSDYSQIGAGTHSFRRVDAEVQQFVPLLRENWVLAFRGLASTTDTAAGHDVPYALMPELGGSHTLRGFSSWRFRDNHRMLLTGEYRWTAGSLVDMAVFVDAGKVAARRADLNFHDLKVSHGFGLRLHTPNTTFTRIEIARSSEGTSLIFSFSPSF